MNSTLVPGKSRQTPASAISSSFVAKVGGVGTPEPSRCVAAVALEKPMAPAESGVGQPGTHARQFVGGGGTFRGGRAHDRTAEGGVTGQEPDVHRRRTALDRGEVVGEGSPREFQSGLEGLQRDGLDPREETDEKLGRGRVNGGQRNPQLPATTVVTPWSGEGESVGSHRTCAS